MVSHSQKYGYEDERFQNVVSPNFHCSICLNVLKEPKMCRSNEHIFCSACITQHLAISSTCPQCKQILTVKSLRRAPRVLVNCLSELIINCDYFSRGCREFVRLEDLHVHVMRCGFAPVRCSNNGCEMEIDKKDRIQHETEVCDFRKVKCHDCGEMKKEIEGMKEQLNQLKEQLNQLPEMKEQLNQLPEINAQLSSVKDDINEVRTMMVELHKMNNVGHGYGRKRVGARSPGLEDGVRGRSAQYAVGVCSRSRRRSRSTESEYGVRVRSRKRKRSRSTESENGVRVRNRSRSAEYEARVMRVWSRSQSAQSEYGVGIRSRSRSTENGLRSTELGSETELGVGERRQRAEYEVGERSAESEDEVRSAETDDGGPSGRTESSAESSAESL